MASCFGTSDSRDTCGPTYSSSCIWYTGQLPKFIISENKLCKANINDIFKAYGEKLDYLITQSNLTVLDKKCLGYDQLNVTSLQLNQIYINEICALKQTVLSLTTQLATLNIGVLPITIDLKNLKTEGAACETQPSTYSLQSLLNIIFNQLSI